MSDTLIASFFLGAIIGMALVINFLERKKLEQDSQQKMWNDLKNQRHNEQPHRIYRREKA